MPSFEENYKFYYHLLIDILKIIYSDKNITQIYHNLFTYLGNKLTIQQMLFIEFSDNNNYSIKNILTQQNSAKKLLQIKKDKIKKIISIHKPFVIKKHEALDYIRFSTPNCISITLLPIKYKNRIFGLILTENTVKTISWSKELIKTIKTALEHFAFILGNSEKMTKIHQRNEQLNDVLEEIKVMRTHLAHSERMASVGELARGIAHEINNPLTGILNYAELIKAELKPDMETYHFTNGIIEEGTRISNIINDLLTFSHYDNSQFHNISPHQLYNSCLSLVNYLLIKDGITVEKEYPDNLPRVYIIKQQIRQVIINIISNARHALNQKYKTYHENKILKLKAYPVQYKNKPYIRFEVYDTGIGIPSQYIQQIFDPFFSTQKPTLGRGLGLCIAYNLTKQNRGYLSVESEENKYTRFILDLPQSVDQPVSE